MSDGRGQAGGAGQRRAAAAALRGWLDEAVAKGAIPGAAWVVARGRKIVDAGLTGCAALTPRRRRLRPGTLYDLASLTKPLVTAALAVRLDRAGRLSLDEPAGERLPELHGSPWERVTLLDLLLHRSGLPAWRPFFLQVRDLGELLTGIAALPPEGAPGEQVVYSDPGYCLAGVVVARAGGCRLDTLFRRDILGRLEPPPVEPRFNPPRAWQGRVAPTEQGDAIHLALAREHAPAAAARCTDWHEGVLRGTVHDRNCRAIGGVAGNAGLFGSAEGVARLAAEFLPGSVLFDASGLTLFERSCTAGLAQERSIGFRVAAGSWGAAGTRVSDRAFGHTGFTGPSLLLDPDTGGVFVLLTNRVHPRPRVEDLTPLRAGFHDRAVALLAAN